jgi:phage baseplate assembly protein W
MAQATTKVERRGLALPAIRTAGGYFASKNRYNTAIGDFLRTIFTPIGSVPGHRNFGCSLNRLLFEPGIAQKPALVRHVVEDARRKWTPHVLIDQMAVQWDEAKRTVRLRFRLKLKDESYLEDRLVEFKVDSVKILMTGGS